MTSRFVFIGSADSPLAIDRYSIMKGILGEEGIFFDRSRGEVLSAAGECGTSQHTKRSGLRLHLFGLLNLIRLCVSTKPKVIIYHGVSVQLLSFIPYIYDVKFILIAQGSDINNALKNKLSLNSFLVKLLLRRSHLVVVKSIVMARTVKALFSKAECEVINWGVPDVFFDCVLENKRAKITVISPRTNKPNYNIDIILAAIRELKGKYAFDYIHLGLGNVYECSDIAGKILKNVSADDMAVVLKNSDIMISIPSQDGFSTSIMESLAAGALPVISDLPAYEGELLDAHLAVRIKSITVADLCDALEDILKDIDQVRADRKKRTHFAKLNYKRELQVSKLREQISRVMG